MVKFTPARSVFRLTYALSSPLTRLKVKDWLKPVQASLGIFLTCFGIFLFYANPYGMRFVSSFALELEEWRGFAPVLLSLGAVMQIRKPLFFISSSILFMVVFLSFDRYEVRSFQKGEGEAVLESVEDGVSVKIWQTDSEIFSTIQTKDYSKESLWASYRAVRRVAAFLRSKGDKKIIASLNLPFSERARLYSIFGEVSRLKGFRDNDKIVFSNHL